MTVNYARHINEIISVTGKLMRDVCVEDPNASGFFSTLYDEATDISVKVQMSVVVQFVKNNAVLSYDTAFLRL